MASIEHGSLVDDEGIRLMKERGTYLVADIYNDDYILAEYGRLKYPEKIIEKERQIGRLQRENFQRAARAGVKIAFGTDAGVYPHGWNAKQFAHMVRWGLTPMQAIQAATVNAADLLGWRDRVGTVSRGAVCRSRRGRRRSVAGHQRARADSFRDEGWTGLQEVKKAKVRRQKAGTVSRVPWTFGALIAAQAMHSIEEYSGRLYEIFPPARFMCGLVSRDLRRGFIIINVLFVGFGVWCYFWPLRNRWDVAAALVWGWAAIEAANGTAICCGRCGRARISLAWRRPRAVGAGRVARLSA